MAIIIFRNWILTSEWPAGGDTLGWISREYLFGKNLFWLYVWRPHSFGFHETINSMDFFLAMVNFIFADGAAAIKFFVFALFLTAAFSAYAFAYNYTRRNFAAFAAALVYVFNQWFFSQLTEGHVDIIFSYALAPFIFLLLDKAIKETRPKILLLLTIAFSIFVSGFHPEFIVIYGFFFVLFVVFRLVHEMRLRSHKCVLKDFFKKLIFVASITFLLTLFVTLPMTLGSSPPYYSREYKYNIEETYGLSYQNFYDAFSLGFVEKGGYDKLIPQPSDISLPNFPITAILFILFFLAYCTIFVHNDVYTMFFAFSMVISVLLSMGPYSPIKEAITWAWFNIPHFAVFRAIDRWISIAAFSHSFFVSVLFDLALSGIKKNRENEKPKISVRVNQIAKHNFTLLGSIKKTLRNLSVMLMVLMLVSSPLSTYFLFRYGLQSYAPPETYIDSLKWVGDQDGDYRVITISKSRDEWVGLSSALSDFSSGGMLTDIGWYHDIGYGSSFIHGKPVLQDGGWSLLARAFVDRARFMLAREKLTDDLLKIFGTFNFRYVVIPPYASEDMRAFFTNQDGVEICYDENGSLILEIDSFSPRIFGSYQKALVVGGLESFTALYDIPSFNLSSTPLLFASQLSKQYLEYLLQDADYIIFVNADFLELVMSILREDSITIEASNYAAPSSNASEFWVKSSYWRYVGAPMFGSETLSTCGNSSIEIPFEIDSQDAYDIWVKVGFAPTRGVLNVYVDDEFIASIMPEGSVVSLKWLNITRVNLTKGRHTLTFKNEGTSFNDINTITIVKPEIFQQMSNKVAEYLRNYSGTILYVTEAENVASAAWNLLSVEYEGRMIYSEFGSNIAHEGEASASSIEFVGVEPKWVKDGDHTTRWSSAKGMPQWLELKWSENRTIAAVEIYFEKALGVEYAIETWDGEKWVQQALVFNQDRSKYQFVKFPNPVSTTKLRIYVTTATEFGSVSIFELNVYPPTENPTLSVNFEIFQERSYGFAVRLATGPDFGSIEVTAEKEVFPPYVCSSDFTEFKWYQGSFLLSSGVNTINVTGIGKTLIDKLVLYSQKLENDFSVDTLFNANAAYPTTSYEKVNPCEYIVHVSTTKPFILIFSDTYHPLWKAYVDGCEFSPIVAYSFVNSFFVNKTGQFDVILYFEGQTYADVGLKISALAFIVALAILVTPSRTLIKLQDKFTKEKSAIISKIRRKKTV